MKIKYRIAGIVIIAVGCTALGCQKKARTSEITAVTPTQMAAIGAEEEQEAALPPGDVKPQDGKVPDKPSITGEPPLPTGMPDDGKTDEKPAITDKPAGEEKDHDDGSSNDKSDDNGGDDSSDDSGDNSGDEGNDDDPEEKTDASEQTVIDEYWKNSFLVWLPEPEGGRFAGFDSDETHDRIILEGMTRKKVLKYIEELEESGFICNAVYENASGEPADGPADGEFGFYACNEDGWSARLRFDPSSGRLTIASGYDVDDAQDIYAELRAGTYLGLLPVFTYGTFDSYNQDGDTYYAVFSNVEGDYSAYCGELKEAGFTEDIDEGDSDGIVWYNAVSMDGYVCEYIYTDGIARIGCGLKGYDED